MSLGLGKKVDKNAVRGHGALSAPIPTSIPGRYFLISYDKNSGCFSLALDDPNNTTYPLGADAAAIVRRFRMWGHEDLGCRACDVAKEYGKCQAIFKGNRTIAGHRLKPAIPRPDVFSQPSRIKSYALPSL